MIHYAIELSLWIGGLFLIGCPLGAAARGLLRRRRAPAREQLPGEA